MRKVPSFLECVNTMWLMAQMAENKHLAIKEELESIMFTQFIHQLVSSVVTEVI